jgi:hypothetical protein
MELLFSLPHLLLQSLEFPLSLALVEIVFALCEKLLLRDFEKLLVA